MSDTCRGQKEALVPLKLKLQVVLSHHMDARHQTLVLFKNSKCSKPLSHLSLTLCICLFLGRLSLHSPDWPGSHYADQTVLNSRDPPDSASQMLGLKACATTTGCKFWPQVMCSGDSALLLRCENIWHNWSSKPGCDPQELLRCDSHSVPPPSVAPVHLQVIQTPRPVLRTA